MHQGYSRCAECEIRIVTLATEDNVRDALRGVPVPKRNGLATEFLTSLSALMTVEDLVGGHTKLAQIAPDELIGSAGNRNGTFGVLANRQAGDVEEGCFLLNAARVCDD